MKLKIHLLFAIIPALFLTACIQDNPADRPLDNSGQPVLEIKTRQEADAIVPLTYTFYAFRAASGTGDYKLYKTIQNAVDGGTIDWGSPEIDGYDFRFLVTAFPSGTQPLKIVGTGGIAPVTDDPWSGLKLAATTSELPLDCYYKVEDMTGDDLLSSRLVSCRLDRIVGQMVFDFQKSTTAQETPAIHDEGPVEYVIDRIYSIEITYSGMAGGLVFDNDGTLRADAAALRGDTTQLINIALTPELFADLSENTAVIENGPDNTGKGVRVKGFHMLPCTDGISVSVLFKYYDTTPACVYAEYGYKPAEGEGPHTHTTDCFGKKTLELNLPLENAEKMLSVKANHLTVNTAKIRTPRVIDVPGESGFGFDVEWK